MGCTDGGVVRLAEDGRLLPHVFILLSSSSSSSSSSVTVSVPASWLSRVPYFATRLSERWIDSTLPHQHITLECTPGSSPQSYLRCLRLLSSSPRTWPPLFQSVKEVLQILPPADHLLFQECWDACMRYLASSTWTIAEEDAIRSTISRLNLEPSSDVKERLDTSHDGAFLQELIYEMVSTPSLETSFGAWCEKWANHSSAPIAETVNAILLNMMWSFFPNESRRIPREWYVLAKCILQFTDAQQFILALVDSEDLLMVLASSLRKNKPDAYAIFKHVLEKVDKKVVLLSNLQRSRLVKWSRHAEGGSSYNNMRLRLAETLPFNDGARLDVVKSSSEKAVRPCMEHILKRVSRMDEAGLKTMIENLGGADEWQGPLDPLPSPGVSAPICSQCQMQSASSKVDYIL